ncbi:uncharacterized protein [Rutidosis leptorrhynchoides]|uniref:uncharacterized protein n=1 Tax=Rutidosis leptorrhynchoides TaxID=125765 RepID=UPI003A994D99
MQKYLKLVQELAVDFDLFQITHVSRTLVALTFSHFKKEIWVEEVKVKSIDTDGVSAVVEKEEQSWMTSIVEFLNKGALPMDSTEAGKIKMIALMYLLDKGILYRKYFLGPHLRCLNPTQAESIIREVHEGMYALHSGHKIVASKIMRLRYYWPSMYRDATERLVPRAEHKANIHNSCTPQANGQCEVTNRDIVLGIKSRLGLCRMGWIDELPKVLWAHRTTPKGVTNETPFSLVYGSEAVILAEINVPTMRIASFGETSNSEELRGNLNLVEERRERATIKETINKQRIASYYNKRVKPLSFQLDDLVW